MTATRPKSGPTRKTSARKCAATPKAAGKIQAAVVVSDLHVWSTLGLWPDGEFKTLHGQYVTQNDFQKYLWDCWIDMWVDRIPQALGNLPYVLIVNGDLVEGKHHKADQVMTGSDDDQFSALMEVMRPAVAGASRIIVTKGTECHTRNLENHAARELGAIPDPNTGHHAWDKLFLDIGGNRLVAKHHMPCATRPWTEATPLRTTLIMERMEALKSSEPAPDIVLSAHRHVYGQDRSVHGLSVSTPPWQGLTRYGYKVVPQAHGMVCGSVVLNFEDMRNGLPDCEEIIYRPKAAKSVAI